MIVRSFIINVFTNNFLRKLKKNKKYKCALLVLNGPSLDLKDVRKFSNYCDCYGVNASLRSKELMDIINVVFIQDVPVFEILLDDVLREANNDKIIALGSGILYRNARIKFKNVVYFNHLVGNHFWSNKINYNLKFSLSPNVVVFDGYSVAYSALQILFSLDYEKVFITGFDGGYSEDVKKRNFIDIGRVDSSYEGASTRFDIFALHAFKAYEKYGKILLNASRVSRINVIPKVSPDDCN